MTLVTIPFTCGRFFKAGVLVKVFFLYFLFLKQECFKVDKYKHYYNIKDCQVIPNQNINMIRPLKTINSREFKSAGIDFKKKVEDPNIAFIQVLKKKVGANRYSRNIKNMHKRGKRSKKKLKKRISETNIIDPGNPKNTKEFNSVIRNNFGHKKLIPLTSVINRVLKRLAIASTNKNEFVDKRAWLINIQKLANMRTD